MANNLIDCLILPQWILPIRPTSQVLEAHAIAIDNGLIKELGPVDEMTTKYVARKTITLVDHVLLPGLINCHTHAAMSLLRGLSDDLPLFTWLEKHIWPTESAVVNADFVRVGSKLAILEMIASGTTCFNDMYFFPEVTAEVAEAAKMRCCVGLIVIDFANCWAKDVDESLTKGLALHDNLLANPLLSTAMAPHSLYTVESKTLERILILAQEMDLQMHIHIAETAHEVTMIRNRTGHRPIALLQELGMLQTRLQAVHATQLNAAEITELANNGSHVIHCPHSNMKLGSGICPVGRLLSGDVNVALGTDGAASNNALDMFAEMRSAAMLAKVNDLDPEVCPATSALEMATINGAIALGLESKIGSLEVGKQADIIAVDLSASNTQPVYNPISSLVYSVNSRQISDVWIQGQRVYQDFQHLTVDKLDTHAEAQFWANKIRKL